MADSNDVEKNPPSVNAGQQELEQRNAEEPPSTPTTSDSTKTASEATPVLNRWYKHPSARLTLIAFVAALIAATVLIGADFIETWSQDASKESREYDRRVDAAEAWAIQYRLQVFAAERAKNPEPTAAHKKVVEDAIAAEIKHTREELALQKPHNARNEFIARLTPFTDIVLSVIRKICAALVILGFLCVLAAIGALFMDWVRRRVDSLFEKAFESSEAEKKIAPPPVVPVVPPTYVGGVGTGGGGMLIAPMAIGATIAGATAAIVVGAITIRVPTTSANAEVPPVSARATYTVDELKIHVKPADVPVTADQITPPNVRTDIPPLAFHFPQIPIDTERMHEFETAMHNYAAALQAQSEHDRRLDDLLTRALQRERENALLQAKLDYKPTEDEVARLKAEAETRNKLDQAVRDSLHSLADGTQEQEKGTVLGALQYLRSLNAQNEHYFNRVFRRELVRRNCDTYKSVSSQFTSKLEALPPCVMPLWASDDLATSKGNPEPERKAAGNSPPAGVTGAQ